ncbi:hypothetical protein ACF1GT_00365 [Streptomyces sp. NPDC014636]|uniref:hypothetical protein n=1 Tax=Streptomyces sp. NPDC014636 TaxID=3364876 RepID=UPI0036F572AF
MVSPACGQPCLGEPPEVVGDAHRGGRSPAQWLDLAHADSAFRDMWGPGLPALFTRLQDVLSAEAWLACRTVLALT